MSGPAIPPGAVQSVARAICDWFCGADPATCMSMPGHMQLAEGVMSRAEAAWPHDPPERPAESPPVYVLAVGYDLDAADVENIQRAVMAALRERKEAPDGAQ